MKTPTEEEELNRVIRNNYLNLNTIEEVDEQLRDKGVRFFSASNKKMKKIMMDAINILLDQRLILKLKQKTEV